jgi:hypothetical protein
MALIPAGNYLGYQLVKDKNVSSGRSFFIETAGVMGMVSGFLVPTLGRMKELNAYLAGGMLGGVLGTYLGFNYKKDQDYRFTQGVFMALSAGGGAAVAVAWPLIFEAEDDRLYTAFGLAGAWTGLLLGEKLSHKIFERSSRDGRQTLKVDLPIIWQWPALLASLNQGTNATHRVELISVNF